MSRQIAYLDEQFIRTYFKLVRLSKGKVELDLADDFMKELGYESIPTSKY